MECLNCKKPTTNPKFCSKSCSITVANKGVRRHGLPPGNCLICDAKLFQSARKYCSKKCYGLSNRTPIEVKKAKNADAQSRYRQKQYRKIHPTSDAQLIYEIYLNRPEGCEVDHIIPLSKGGLHHQDNLQYLPKLANRQKGSKVGP